VGGLNDKTAHPQRSGRNSLRLGAQVRRRWERKEESARRKGAMEVKVRAAMQGNFAMLTSVPDHVEFVATTSEYQIKNLLTLADLKDAIKENGVCDNP
jgi:hypothetical protein